ncbi:MAG: hypothetical protein JSS10_09760 [Verrucomicrobia bacterium]|nr:hypothetical protein [Verrucomicrobiota bacterium]
MNVSAISSRAVHHLSRLPPRSYVPLCMTLIPVMIQFLYRTIRMRTYRRHCNLYAPTEYEKEGVAFAERNVQHRGFLFAAVTQTVVFSALAIRNRYYLIPASYSLLHLTWTHMSKQKEKLLQEQIGTELRPVFSSMDGEIRFN